MTRVASCGCGALSIRVHGEPLGTGICHCLACQRRTGSVFAALAAFAAPWEITGASSHYRRTGDAGASFVFHFCPLCGTNLFHIEDGVNGQISVAVGGFADPVFPPPEDSVYECRRHSWVTLPDAVIRHDRDPQ